MGLKHKGGSSNRASLLAATPPAGRALLAALPEPLRVSAVR